jgi:hypothetical protein
MLTFLLNLEASLPTPYTSSAMPPTLPSELLSDILDLATSPYETPSAYKDDQQFLKNCCLVSKQLCRIAQPMLWSVLQLNKRTFSLLSSRPKLAQHARVLEIKEAGDARDTIFGHVGVLPNLFEVRLEGGELSKYKLRRLQCTSWRSCLPFIDTAAD